MSLLKLAHLSDLHFSNWDWNPAQFFSKRWLGNLNFLFGRRRIFAHERLGLLPALFKEQGITHVLITGDLTTTSAPAEFEKARVFIQLLEAQGLQVFCIPGNHDQYTRKAYEQHLFYNYFPMQWNNTSAYNLKKHGMTAQKISDAWWLVGLDTALATSWFFSSGYFSENTEKNLIEFLSKLPTGEQVILFNHFPFFQHETPRKRLERGGALRKILERFPQVKIYCHGHTHRQCLADLRPSQLPIILDSGSIVHRDRGTWHQLTLSPEKLVTEVFSWKDEKWQANRQISYDLV
jgi:3',5'-cyclic AMP phosphodiesterase CpdA